MAGRSWRALATLWRVAPPYTAQRLARLLPRPGVDAVYRRWSGISSLHDQQPPPSEYLIDLALDAARRASRLRLTDLEARAGDGKQRRFLETWPGEHYRFLAALAAETNPGLMVEVGTETGAGCLSMLAGCPTGRMITYDLKRWTAWPNTLLRPADFDSGQVEQRLGNLAKDEFFDQERATLAAADMIFVDGPKDRVFEPVFIDKLLTCTQPTCLLVLDDIRLLPMISLWRKLPWPKLDITSFGHWSGTGLARAAVEA